MATSSRLSQFHELAKYYDALNDWKDYREEARRLEAIARRFGRPGKTSWLDVACGTGRHLGFLRQRHRTTGVDGSREMLRIARRRLPGVPLVRGDMRTVRLGREFDVVSCLFGAIGHLPTARDVERTFANFARHLTPGGVAIVEPWIDRSTFRPGSLHLRTHVDPDLTIARLAYSSRHGRQSRVRYHFLVGRPGRDVQYFQEADDGVLLTREELLTLMRRVGLGARFLSRGFLPGRGLIVGTKPKKANPIPKRSP